MTTVTPAQSRHRAGSAGDGPPTITSPARGLEMKHNLLSRLRAPPLVHTWEFWHDRQGRTRSEATTPTTPSSSSGGRAASIKYEDRLVHLHTIPDVRAFWSTFNNFDVGLLPLRDSVHLFHKGVKPVWEDARNARGGSWTFRVPAHRAAEFWRDVCLLAIGETLQAAVASQRVTFRDDVCGVSLSVRYTSVLVQVWNRNAGHVEGVARLLGAVRAGLAEDLRPVEGSYYYKRHSEHAGFGAHAGAAAAAEHA